MADDEIEPSEAVRILACAAIPDCRSEIVERFSSKTWDWYPPEESRETDAVNQARTLFFAKRAEFRASGVFNGQGRRADIPQSEFSRGHLDIWKRELDCSIAGSPKRVWRDVLVGRQGVETLKGKGAKGKGGRSPATDWSTVEEALRINVCKHGMPKPDGPPGWRNQADACEWVAELLSVQKENAADSTIREHVRDMLQRIATEMPET